MDEQEAERLWAKEADRRLEEYRSGRAVAVDVRKVGTEIASLFKKIGLDADIPELRGNEIKPASLD